MFLASLPTIDRISASLCRRHRLDPAEADEFGARVRMKLVESDYAVLGKFQGRSSLDTYLTSVIANLFQDYHVRGTGRWRASSAAKRLGTTAVRLEQLLYRDRHTLREAGEVLRSAGLVVDDPELARIAAQLPERTMPRRNGKALSPGFTAKADERADDRILQTEQVRLHDSASAALSGVLPKLPSEDRLILQLHFWEDMAIAEIARALSLPQKPLYRRVNAILARLRELLESDGVPRSLIFDLLAARDRE